MVLYMVKKINMTTIKSQLNIIQIQTSAQQTIPRGTYIPGVKYIA